LAGDFLTDFFKAGDLEEDLSGFFTRFFTGFLTWFFTLTELFLTGEVLEGVFLEVFEEFLEDFFNLPAAKFTFLADLAADFLGEKVTTFFLQQLF
jgi:hypothetical protein